MEDKEKKLALQKAVGERVYHSRKLARMSKEELAERLTGRYPCEDVIDPKTGELLASREEMITYKTAEEIVAAGITSLKIRSVINCRAKNGACSRCYGGYR